MNLDGYVTVNERLTLALAQYPELRIIEEQPEVRTIDNIHYVEVCVTVYRSPDDPLPVVARAWEPWPGKTPFVRDSEMMNCATSALGRALGYMGLGLGKSIASRDEVQQRQTEEQQLGGNKDYRPPKEDVQRGKSNYLSSKAVSEAPRGPGRATPGQLRIIDQMARERGIEAVVPETFEAASAEIARLKEIPRP
jgi:hypothetical protein